MKSYGKFKLPASCIRNGGPVNFFYVFTFLQVFLELVQLVVAARLACNGYHLAFFKVNTVKLDTCSLAAPLPASWSSSLAVASLVSLAELSAGIDFVHKFEQVGSLCRNSFN